MTNMEKLCIFFVLAILSSQALGMSYRNRRQAPENEEDLEDRYGWFRPNRPGRPGGRFPQQPQGPSWNPWQDTGFPVFPMPTPRPTPIPTPAPNDNSVTTGTTGGSQTDEARRQACISSCPVTSEYNPVCGSDNVTYDNPGRLMCAQACGVTVNLLRSSRCPATTAAPAS